MEDYWQRDGFGPQHKITTLMKLRRFKLIKRYINICDDDGEKGQTFFFNKPDPRFGSVMRESKKL